MQTKKAEEYAVRQPAAVWRWITWGIFAGILYGVGHTLFWCYILDKGIGNKALMIATTAGGVIGAGFGGRYHASKPTETNLSMWLSVVVGTISAIGFVLRGGPPNGRRDLLALLSLAFVPVFVGLLVGAFFDRVSANFLFVARGPG